MLCGRKCKIKKLSLKRKRVRLSLVAEMVGFEPTCLLITDKTISSRSRYDHFDTSPN